MSQDARRVDPSVQRSDGWIDTTWNNMSDAGAFARTGAEEQEGGGGEPPLLAGAGVVVCLMGEGERLKRATVRTSTVAVTATGSSSI